MNFKELSPGAAAHTKPYDLDSFKTAGAIQVPDSLSDPKHFGHVASKYCELMALIDDSDSFWAFVVYLWFSGAKYIGCLKTLMKVKMMVGLECMWHVSPSGLVGPPTASAQRKLGGCLDALPRQPQSSFTVMHAKEVNNFI